MLSFERIINVFEPKERISWRADHVEGAQLADYFPGDPGEFAIVANGLEVDGSYVPSDGDQIAVAHVPEAGIGTGLLIAILVAGGSFLVQRALAPRPPGVNLPDDGPTNAFGGARTLALNGAPIPLIYGETLAAGNVIEQHEDPIFDANVGLPPPGSSPTAPPASSLWQVSNPRNQRIAPGNAALSMRAVLCAGPVEEIHSVKIDDIPIEEFPGMTAAVRPGDVDQLAIDGFDETRLEVPINEPVDFGSAVTVTTDNEVDTVEIVLLFPDGIYKKHSSVKYSPKSTSFLVRYRVNGSSTWITSNLIRVQDVMLSPLEVFVKIPDVERNRYQVQIDRISADDADSNNVSNFNLQRIVEVQFGGMAHPGMAQVALRQIPGDQIQPLDVTTITAIVKGRNDIRQYTDESTYTVGYTKSPAWCCAHFLTNVRDGLGRWFSWENIDIPSFIAWAAHSAELVTTGRGTLEPRHEFNFNIDRSTNAAEILQLFAAGTDVSVIYRGSKFIAVIDEQSDDVVQVFSEANILQGTLAYLQFPKTQLATRLSAEFINREVEWQRDHMHQEDDDLPVTTDHISGTVDLLHITSPAQVARELKRLLRNNKYITEGVEFECGLQGIAVQYGDVIELGAKAIDIGMGSGVIKMVVGSKILYLDDDLLLEVGETYEITVQHLYDGSITTKALVTPAPTQTTNIVEAIDADWPIRAGDKYTVGKTSAASRRFRVDEVKRTGVSGQFRVRIRAGVENDLRFVEEEISNPFVADIEKVINYRDRPGFVRNLDATFEENREVIIVTWNSPNSFTVAHYEVFIRFQEGTTANENWISAGITKGRYFEIRDIIEIGDNFSYGVTVSAVSPAGYRKSFDEPLHPLAIVRTGPIVPE